MILYSFDPGKTTGFAKWILDDGGKNDFTMPVSFGELSIVQLYKFLDDLTWDEVVNDIAFIYENYRIRNNPKHRGFNHQWNTGDTLRVIGAIEFRAYQMQIPIHSQEPNVRSVGAGFSGLAHDPNKHDKDHISAMKHGYYYMVKSGKMKPRE